MAQNNHTAQERYLSEARLQLRRAGEAQNAMQYCQEQQMI